MLRLPDPQSPVLGAAFLTARVGQLYFAAQALIGALWWISVFTVPAIRTATLGSLDPVVLAVVDVPLFVVASALVAFGVRWAVWITGPWTLLIAGALAVFATVTGEAGWGAFLMIAAAVCTTGASFLVWLGRLPSEWIITGPFSARVAPAASSGVQLGRTMLQIVVFWTLLLGVFPAIIAMVEFRWGLHVEIPLVFRLLGGAIFVLAASLGLWAATVMSTRGEGTPLPALTARKLVILGPYRWVRNPMAIAGIGQGVAVGIMMSSWLVVGYALCGALIWNWLVRPHEEAELEDRFGDEFRAYSSAISCWVPRSFRPLPESLLSPMSDGNSGR